MKRGRALFGIVLALGAGLLLMAQSVTTDLGSLVTQQVNGQLVAPAGGDLMPLYRGQNGVSTWTTITRLFASPAAIGGTAPAAGTFTTATAGQFLSSAGTPTIASGACGTTTNGAVVAGSTNQTGGITIGAAATTTCTLTWSATLAVAPKACVFFPANAAAAATGTTVAFTGAPSTTQVVLTGAALANANYSYICL
jgi:hypothetical protein